MALKSVIVVESEPSQQGRSYTGSTLTAFEQVANRPIVHHVLDAVRAGSTGGIIVAGEARALSEMRACLREYQPPLDRIDYALCRAGAGIGSVLSAVAPLVGEAPCLIQPANGLLEQPIGELIALLDASEDLVLFATPQSEDASSRDLSTLGLRADARPGRVVAAIGLFGPGGFNRAAERLRRAGGADLADAGRHLVADGAPVRLHPVNGWHHYRGHGRDLLALNRVALDRLTGSTPTSGRAGNSFEGRVLIDPTAMVRSSSITGPSVIGPRTTVIDAYVGPYTSIGAGARIEGVEIERSIVSPGASVTHIGGRLVSSLVGPDARVYRDFSLPRALRLWVGDSVEVGLC